MTRTTFLDIEPLLTNRRVDKENKTVHCVFSCPVTARQVSASAHISQGGSLGDRLLDSTSESFWYNLRRQVADTICSFLPNGFVREVAEGAAWRMVYGHDDSVHSKGEIEQATVDAFMTVSDEFVRVGERWTGREVSDDFANDFQRQLQRAPITTNYEGQILARALIALASADGIDHSERQFLASYCDGSSEPSQEWRAPTMVELSEVGESVRASLYMLACALALIDQQRTEPERAYLQQLERGLALEPEQARGLRTAAGHFIIEQSVQLTTHSHNEPTPKDLAKLAQLAELSVEEVERVLVRRRKRSL